MIDYNTLTIEETIAEGMIIETAFFSSYVHMYTCS